MADRELRLKARARLVAQVRQEELNCWLCGLPIDLALPPTHRRSSTVDEIIPRSLSVDPKRAALDRSNVRHCHRDCNSRRGNRMVVPLPTRRSREW